MIPPCIRPTAPPLAPAILKAFLEQGAPRWDVRVHDINLEYYYQALDLMEKGALKLNLYDWSREETAANVRSALDFLKNQRIGPWNIREYHRQATRFLSFENVFNAFMSEMALRSLAGIPVPGRIGQFFDSLFEKVASKETDMVAISVLFDSQMPFALLLARRLKEITGAAVYLGGAKFGVSPEPGSILSRPVIHQYKGRGYRVFVRDFVDGVVSGEGEIPLLHLLNARDMEDAFKAPGLAFWQGGEVVQNPPAVMDDLNLLPAPDFTALPLADYISPEIILPLMTARGCPWGKCVFCTHHASYKRYRQRSIERVVDDIECLKERHGARLFNFYDEMIPPARFRKMAWEITGRGLEVCYSAYGKPARGFDRDTLAAIRRSGCRMILWGVESASQRVLDLMKKGTRVEDIQQVLREAARLGIKNLVFIMFGFPGETEEEFLDTIHFLERNRDAVHALSKGRFRLMEGSEISRRPRAFGITRVSRGRDDPLRSAFLGYEVRDGLGPGEVERLYKGNLGRLEGIGLSPRFGTYRDHLLSWACGAFRGSDPEGG